MALTPITGYIATERGTSASDPITSETGYHRKRWHDLTTQEKQVRVAVFCDTEKFPTVKPRKLTEFDKEIKRLKI